jgi:hypothetical protein
LFHAAQSKPGTSKPGEKICGVFNSPAVHSTAKFPEIPAICRFSATFCALPFSI